jgi:hypothetical protein
MNSRASATAFRINTSIPCRKPAASSARVGSSELPGRQAEGILEFKVENAARSRAFSIVKPGSLGFPVHESEQPPDVTERGFTVDHAARWVPKRLHSGYAQVALTLCSRWPAAPREDAPGRNDSTPAAPAM